ncbi:MAG: hypothetical protein ACLTLQ_12410 [[Clostridium] scindens]
MQEKMVKTHQSGNGRNRFPCRCCLKGADIFVGVSAPGIVTEEMVASMNTDAILFAMAQPSS